MPTLLPNMLNMLFVDSSNIQLSHPHWAFPRSTHLNGLIVLHKPAISWSLSGAELFATDSQLTCQEIASGSKPISSQAPTTQLPQHFRSQLDYFQPGLWERAGNILQRECAVPISRSDRRCHCIEPFLSPPSLSTRALHLPDAQE